MADSSTTDTDILKTDIVAVSEEVQENAIVNRSNPPDKEQPAEGPELSNIDVDDDIFGECEVDWMTPEEENNKIIDVLKEVAGKCTQANPKKRPTSFEVLDLLYSVYDPPRQPFSCKLFCELLREESDSDEELTSDTHPFRYKV